MDHFISRFQDKFIAKSKTYSSHLTVIPRHIRRVAIYFMAMIV